MVDKSQNELEHLGPTFPDPSEARALSCGFTIKAMGFVMFCVQLLRPTWNEVGCLYLRIWEECRICTEDQCDTCFLDTQDLCFFYKTDIMSLVKWCLSANCFWRVARIKRNHFNMSATTEKSREVQKYHKISLIVWHYFTIRNNSRNYTSQVSGCGWFLGLLISSCPYQDWVVKQWYASHSLFSSCIWLFPADQAGPPKGRPPAWSEMVKVYFIKVVSGGRSCVYIPNLIYKTVLV